MKNIKQNTTKYEVFPGMYILYHSIHKEKASLDAGLPESGDSFEILHCREGRMECRVGNEFCYISPGDLLIVRKSQLADNLYFPLGHYHGITVHIDIKSAPKCLSCFLRDVAVQPASIIEKFCGDKPYFIARSNQSFEHIYSELYKVPGEIRQGYFKIKILELMLFLSVFDCGYDESPVRLVLPQQVSLAKSVCKYLTDNMEERVTLEQVSERFHISPTNIKNAFKAVYGVSFYAFTKTQKMESAAYMLEYTDKTIIEIAGEHGYDNSSKFASAFRSVKGMAPNEYRMMNKSPARLN